ncbi:hypothetical protein WJX72_000329 [[Myrmecia] bisecta]|uniref:SURF1-like protein n=1 Tax=[Myrmecia] bisecta TaxID=41462 RepID=A0AAW1Q027_9CHLO
MQRRFKALQLISLKERAGQEHQQKQGRSSAYGWVLLVPAAIAGFLGCWQVNRRQWKQELLQRRTAALQAEPVDILQAVDVPEEYTRVTCRGELQHDKSVFLGPRPRTVMGTSTPGYVVITPLRAPDWGRAVLVARGWAPAEWRDDASLRQRSEPAGEVQVTGVVRGSENRSSFVPDNQPERGAWYWIDVPALAHACGLPSDTPLVEVMTAEPAEPARSAVPTSMDVLAMRTSVPHVEEQYPLAKPAADLLQFSVMPDDHRNYALIWFSLAGITLPLALRAVKQRRVPR